MKNLLLTIGALLCFTSSFAQLSVTISPNNVTCWGAADGSATAVASGGTAPYTYNWTSTGDTTAFINNLPAGTYNVVVTDAVGATTAGGAIIGEPTQILTATFGNPANCTSGGSAAVSVTGGSAPYTFLWSNGSTIPQLSNLAPGFYTVTVMDGNACIATDSVTVVGSQFLNVSIIVTYDSCLGTACLFADVADSNAWFNWNNGAITQQICGLSDGSYAVTVTDALGCTGIQSTSIVNLTTVVAAATSTPASCGNDGSVIATATNGVPPYTYLWSNNATTSVVSNLPAGNYTVTITDANSCSTTASTTISSGSFTLGSATTTPSTCAVANNGTATILVTGTNPPFTYAWSNTDTTSTITGLAAGTYVVTVTDNGGCVLVQTLIVSQEALQAQTGIVTEVPCLDSTNGALYATVLNGTAPYAFEWSTGATTDTVSNLSLGGYTVTITDANSCQTIRHQFVTEDTDCYALLRGKAYVDFDANCALTAGDHGVGGLMVRIEPGYTAYTHNNGDWNALVRQGNYKVFVPNVGQAASLTNTCSIDTLNLAVLDTTTRYNNDFPKTTTVLNNVSVYVSCGVARPGFTQGINVTLKNLGYSPADVSGSVVLDSIFSSVSTFYTVGGVVIDSTTTNPLTVHYSYSGLAPQQSKYFIIYAVLPTIPTVSLGQTVTHSASISLLNTADDDTTNNNHSCSIDIVGAYDPNDKQVFNALDESIDGLAAVEDTLLRYYIRFQNTGTDTAFNVVVRDTLDSDLDVATFRFIAASHDVVIEFYEEHIVHFVFNNILLPDSNVNEPLSHGFIEFDIEVLDKGQLEEVTNQAAIYFDFNPPIYTNVVATQRAVGITEKVSVPVNVFPNPTTGLLSVNLGGQLVEQVELYDLMGKRVLSTSFSPTIQANLHATGVSNGLYIVRIRSGAAWYQDKVMVLH